VNKGSEKIGDTMCVRAPRLTEQQIASFHEAGYVWVPGGIPREQARALGIWAHELAKRPVEVGRHWVYHELSLRGDGRQLITRIENLVPFHDGYRQLAEALHESVGQLFGEDAVLFKDKINYKMPGGDGFKAHQDAQAGWGVYAREYISVLVSIDASTVESGCLEVTTRPAKKLIGNQWEPLDTALEFTPLPTQPGDLLYFDAYVPHRSAPNRSANSRRLFYATYNRLSEGDNRARYFADKRKSYPPDIEREAGKNYIFRV